MRAWMWFARHVGFRLAWRYYRAGRKRGWMTYEQSDRFLAALTAGESIEAAYRKSLRAGSVDE